MRLIALAILCLSAALAAAQPADDSAQTPITIQPTHRLLFPDSPDIGSVAFSPDGKIMYVHLRPEAVDVWAMLVYVWPEGMGAVVAIALVGAGLACWRVRSRPQRAGVPYCRKCNYDLSGLPERAAPTCPECGVDLARRRARLGRALRWRVGPIAVPLVILMVGYAAMWAAGLPRAGRASSWISWLSPGLYQAVNSRGITRLSGFETRVDRVVAVDTATGHVTRTICERPAATWFPIKMLPDGAGLFLGDSYGGGLVLVDVASGRERARLEPGGYTSFGSPKSDTVVGFADGGHIVYAVGAANNRVKTRVYEWDLARGTSRVVHETGASGYGPRRVVMLPGEPGPRFIVAPDFMEAHSSKQYILEFAGPGMDARPPILMPAMTSPSSGLVVTPDGTRLFASGMSRGIVGMDLVSGESLGVLRPGMREHPNDEIALSPDGDLLYVSVHPDAILVRRLSVRRWVARLRYPEGFIALDLFVSPDGRWLAAVPFRAAGPQGPFIHEVLLFDLTTIPPPSASGAG